MLPHSSPRKRKKPRRNPEKETPPVPRFSCPKPLHELQGPDHLIASSLPEGFPPELAFRALAAYSLLRTLSRELRLSPFTPNVFLRALLLPYPNRLLGEIHSALLRVLLPSLQMGYSYRERGGSISVAKKRRVDGVWWDLRAGDNLTYLDGLSWPLFYDDYVHLTADVLWGLCAMDAPEQHVNFRNAAMHKTLDDFQDIQNEPELQNGDTDESLGIALPIRPSVSSSPQTPLQRQPAQRARNTQMFVDSDSEPNDSGSEFDANDCDDMDDDEDFELKPRARRGKRGRPRKQKAVVDSGTKQSDVLESPSQRPTPKLVPGSRVTELCKAEFPGVFVPLPLPSAASVPSTSKAELDTLPSKPVHSRVEMVTLPEQTLELPIKKGKRGRPPMDHSMPPSKSTIPRSFETNEPSAKRAKQLADTNPAAGPRFYQHANGNAGMRPMMIFPYPYGVNSTMPPFPFPNVSGPPVLMQPKSGAQLHVSMPGGVPYDQICASNGPYSSIVKNAYNAAPPNPNDVNKLAQNTKHTEPFIVPAMPKWERPAWKPAPDMSAHSVPVEIADSIQNFLMGHDGNHVGESDRKPPSEALHLETASDIVAPGQGREQHGAPDGSLHVSTSSTDEARTEMVSPTTITGESSLGHKMAVPNATGSVSSATTLPKETMNDEKSGCSESNADETAGLRNTEVEGSKAVCDLSSNCDHRSSSDDLKGENSPSLPSNAKDHIEHDDPAKVDAKCEDKSSNGVDRYYSFPSLPEEWPQFAPLKSMRSGVPYHRLPLEQKMQALEFLLDELLTVDFIAAEMTRRERITACFGIPYGALPSEEELRSLENEDECGVCRLEGELLCCDGCTRSYHRRCIGMPRGAHLPEGKWLCPECAIPDPCRFGPLRGGEKPSIDWFTLKDLKPDDISNEVDETDRNALQNSLTDESTRTKQSPEDDDAKLSSTGCHEKVYHGTTPAPLQSLPKDIELLVVHGFLFTRPVTNDGDSRSELIDVRALCKNKGHDRLPAELNAMYHDLKKIGPELTRKWPLAQIPLEPSKIWSSACDPERARRLAQYFSLAESYDPSSYISRYRLAPIPLYMCAGKGSNMNSLVLSEYESQCSGINTRMLSGIMTRDMTQDVSVVKSLRCSAHLFSPYQMIAGYLVKLELALRHACLLDERWGIKNGRNVSGKWPQQVTECRSVRRLARKLVNLVDACHSRVFFEDWFALAGPNGGAKHNRSSRDSMSSTSSSDVRHYFTLPTDWTPEGEMKRRKWERASNSNILTLLAGESSSVDTVVKFTIRNQRGRKKRKNILTFKNQYSQGMHLNEKDHSNVVGDNSAVPDTDKLAASSSAESISNPVQACNTAEPAPKPGHQNSSEPIPNLNRQPPDDQAAVPSPTPFASHNSGAVLVPDPAFGENRDFDKGAQKAIDDPTALSSGVQEAKYHDAGDRSISVAKDALGPTSVVVSSTCTLGGPDAKYLLSGDPSIPVPGHDDTLWEDSDPKPCVDPSAKLTGEKDGKDQIASNLLIAIGDSSSMEESIKKNSAKEPSESKLIVDPSTRSSEGLEEEDDVTKNLPSPARNSSTAFSVESAAKNSAPEQCESKSATEPSSWQSMENRVAGDPSATVPIHDSANPAESAAKKSVSSASTPEISIPAVNPAQKLAAQKKKKPKTTKKRTRRSGRLSNRTDVANVIDSLISGKDEPSESLELPGEHNEKNLGQTALIDQEKKARLAKLESLVTNNGEKEIAWPLAGRKLFDPIGYLPPAEMRRLGRNAGVVVAPFVKYSSSYEVGEVSVYHAWRKRVLRACAFEDLIMLIRTLDSFINQSVSETCSGIFSVILDLTWLHPLLKTGTNLFLRIDNTPDSSKYTTGSEGHSLQATRS